MKYFNTFKRFLKAKTGVAALEFALMAPIYATLMLGVVETSNWLYVSQKMENAANNLLNIMNQELQLKNENLRALAAMIPLIMRPIEVSSDDYGLVVTSVQSDKPGPNRLDKPYVYWQEVFGNSSLTGKMLNYKINAPNRQNIIPQGSMRNFQFSDGDQIILVEIGMRYKPMVTSSIIPSFSTNLQYYSFSRPRKGAFAFKPDQLDN